LQHHPLYLALGKDAETRGATYRDLFRSELDEAVLTNLRLVLMQGQPLGSERFKEAMSAAAGVRRTQTQRGRPVKLPDKTAVEDQTDFGF